MSNVEQIFNTYLETWDKDQKIRGGFHALCKSKKIPYEGEAKALVAKHNATFDSESPKEEVVSETPVEAIKDNVVAGNDPRLEKQVEDLQNEIKNTNKITQEKTLMKTNKWQIIDSLSDEECKVYAYPTGSRIAGMEGIVRVEIFDKGKKIYGYISKMRDLGITYDRRNNTCNV